MRIFARQWPGVRRGRVARHRTPSGFSRHSVREEVDAVLVRNGIGVLSLVDGDQPYASPMSFGYSGERVAFPMQMGTGGRSGASSRTPAPA
ncbi:MAG: pyridoxamine 5'-phosphate oxidase family protein [Haloarculaceae archaeon]